MERGTARQAELRTSLEIALAVASSELQLNARGRLCWLAHHLGLYATRLAAFAAVPTTSSAALAASDLAASVAAAVIVIEGEVAQGGQPASAGAAWGAVRGAADALPHGVSGEIAARLVEAVRGWQGALEVGVPPTFGALSGRDDR